MNSWRVRFTVCILMMTIMAMHDIATESVPNTPEGMLVYHGSGALFDWLLLMIVPRCLSGDLCKHSQWLLLVSIIGNFGGWILYMAYASPSLYNVFMWVLTAAQWLRLIIPDRHDAVDSWFDLVRHRDRLGSERNT